MKIITERKREMKGNGKEGNKMKGIVIAVLVAVALVNAGSAFAYWKAPAGVEVRDPAPDRFNINLF